MGAFAFWSANMTNHAAARSAAATRLSDAYEHAHYAVGAEESLERKYRLEPGPVVRRHYAVAAEDFSDALEDIGQRGTPADRLLVDGLLAKQHGYLLAIRSMFAAVDAHQTQRVLAIDHDGVDPLFGAIAAGVEQAATAHTAAAQTKLASLRGSERRVLVGTTITIALGLALLSFFAVLLVRINRELHRNALQSEHDALHDDLTGLPNRRLLLDRLDHLIAVAARDPSPFSLLMIDLDRFKEINDTLGHRTGDLLLQAIGPRLQPLLRPTDTLARIGGDEFVILLPTASLQAAREIAERARQTLSRAIALPDFVATIDSSIGIVSFPRHGEDAETLMQRADIAMYLAKTERTGDAIYDPLTDPYDPERLSLIADLRDAIAAKAIEVYYQPKFDVRTLQPIGVEALARWNHPERGMIRPDEFIPLAEHTGLIKPLTELVLRQAVRQCRSWEDAGRSLPVAVNLSVANLLDIDLVPTIGRILEEERLAPTQLQLEITESTIMVDPERAQRVLLELAEMGIALSVDDFGTGYSSLAYLRRLPVQELKIDQSFIRHLAADNEDAAVVRATIQLGHSLGLTIVAEGVEDARSLERLTELGCDSLQGFHLCVPQPPDALLAILDALEARPAPARCVTA
ncbi:MAG: putative bifunctional diguanylate cyclase/phosphodiesterase [Gaiellaceae bacterium]